jgi:thiamine biosynthesis lipoprotein
MLGFIIWTILTPKPTQEFSSNLFYMDTYINVKVYGNDADKANEVLDEVDKIYKEYHELTDRYNEYNNLNNIYYINNNRSDIEKIKIDEKLYSVLDYGIKWNGISNQLLNINLGNVIDIWKEYRQNKDGIPTIEELKNSGSINIEDIVLLEDNYILNNHPNIDLGAISKGYTTKIVGDYLKEQGFDKFLINAGGNVLLGEHYHNDVYKIGIEEPNGTGGIYQILKGKNIAVITSGSYERFYEYEGNLYHHIINPKTLMPTNHMKSVTVITSDSALGDILSTILFLMPIQDGQEFIKQFENVEAIWFANDDTVIKSPGFSNYE